MTITRATNTRLEDWIEANKPAKDMLSKSECHNQINFVRDTIPTLLGKSIEEQLRMRDEITVISTHTSRSILLPVFRVELEDGTAFTMRCNFSNWIVSVDSPRAVEADFLGLFNPNKRALAVYCEGFPEELVYGPYAENKRQFTLMLPTGFYQHGYLFTFLWIFRDQVLGNRQNTPTDG